MLLDSEGRYELVAATIPDYLALRMPDDEFASARQELVEVGFAVAASRDDIWQALEGAEEPNDYRHKVTRAPRPIACERAGMSVDIIVRARASI